MAQTVVTGGAGFIGSHVVRALLDRGERVVVIDNFDDYYDPAIKRRNVAPFLGHPNARLIEADIRDAAAMSAAFAGIGPHRLVHLAGRGGVRPSLALPYLYFDLNLLGTVQVLEVSRAAGCAHAVVASSSSVYGTRTDGKPFREDEPLEAALSPYGASKQAMERYAESFQGITGIPVTALRFFSVYGPGQRPDMAIHQFVRRIEAGETITAFGDGSSTRDHTYIADIVQGVLAALDRPHGYRVYNLGEFRTVSLRDLLQAIETATGKRASVVWEPMRPEDMPATYADITRAKTELGYDPRFSLERGLGEFVRWYRGQS
ncbi:NAD-dependent epimerase/dehydratase family protein [Patescibacteria group bacterium]|nr:MAG: NAD-dependent epimerase/dehydratase family protein [Patescibacteria group bacterium]